VSGEHPKGSLIRRYLQFLFGVQRQIPRGLRPLGMKTIENSFRDTAEAVA